MIKLVRKHDWLELKAENLLLKEELEVERARAQSLQEKVDAWQEKKPYCGKHCAACKHSYTIHNGFLKEHGCYLNAKNECNLFDRKEEG